MRAISSWIVLALACTDSTNNPSPDSEPPDDTPPPDTASPPPPEGLVQFDGAAPTNLLFVTLDTTRWDYIGRHGGSDTPNLDAFLAEAVSLDEHRSCSNWTGPSMTCIASGRSASTAGFWPLTEEPGVSQFPPPDWETLAEQLTNAGWDTRLISTNTAFGTRYGLSRGFLEISEPEWLPAADLTDRTIDEVEDLLAVPGVPWYLHVHYSDPHGPYCPLPEYLNEEILPPFDGDPCTEFEPLRASYWEQTEEWQNAYKTWMKEYYRAELEGWDVAFGELLAGLDALGAREDVLLVFATDHGEQLGERNAFGHGILMGPEESRSTAAFWARNLAPVAWTGTTYHPDLVATLHDVFDVVPSIPIDGLPVGTAPADYAVPIWNIGSGIRFSEYAEEWGGTADAYLSVVRGDVQLNYDWLGNRAFYHLDTDPEAMTDVYDATDPDVIDLWTIMNTSIENIAATFVEFPDPVDPGP